MDCATSSNALAIESYTLRLSHQRKHTKSLSFIQPNHTNPARFSIPQVSCFLRYLTVGSPFCKWDTWQVHNGKYYPFWYHTFSQRSSRHLHNTMLVPPATSPSTFPHCLYCQETHGSIPNDGLRLANCLGVQINRSWTAIQTHKAICDAIGLGNSFLDLTILTLFQSWGCSCRMLRDVDIWVSFVMSNVANG